MTGEPVKEEYLQKEETLEIDLRQIYEKLFKQRRLIGNTILICVILALLYSCINRPVYKSTARIMIEGKPPKIVKVEETVLPDYTDRANYYNSQIEVLKSHSIANLVFNELGDYQPWGNLRGRPRKAREITRDERVNALLKTVKITPVRMTQIIEISAEDVNPQLAEQIANTWVDAYIVYSSLDQFIQRKAELQSDIEQNLKYLKDKHPIIQGLQSEIDAINAKISGEKQKLFASTTSAFSFIKEGQKITNVKILDAGEFPLKPVRPRLFLNLLLAFFLGAGIGIGVVFLLENMDQSIKLQSDIEGFLHLACLTTVPVYAPEEGKNGAPALVCSKENNSAFAERFRGLRTNIIYSNPDLSKKVIMVTSCAPGEGKSTTAVDLATVFAQFGEKVILIDADLRKPTLHNVFNVSNAGGITELLAYDNLDIKTHIKKTGISNLDFLPSGIIPPNPAELLGSKKIEGLIQEFLKNYDRIIFDTPPVLAATDSVILSTKVDACILVFKAGATHRQAALRSVKLIRSVHSNVLGVVLNMFKAEEFGYHAYYHYYHYAKDGKNKEKKA
ncbi:MAG: polysaccharide biosynthesis tyrosine autokinase [Candidatus Omnitrophota bacterium]